MDHGSNGSWIWIRVRDPDSDRDTGIRRALAEVRTVPGLLHSV